MCVQGTWECLWRAVYEGPSGLVGCCGCGSSSGSSGTRCDVMECVCAVPPGANVTRS
jgi:hypothetical protein